MTTPHLLVLSLLCLLPLLLPPLLLPSTTDIIFIAVNRLRSQQTAQFLPPSLQQRAALAARPSLPQRAPLADRSRRANSKTLDNQARACADIAIVGDVRHIQVQCRRWLLRLHLRTPRNC